MAAKKPEPAAAMPAPSAAEKKAAAAAEAKAKHPRIKVRAIQDGYYDDVQRRVGDVFTIDGSPVTDEQAEVRKTKKKTPGLPADFSEKWMELVDDDTPERTTSHNEVLRQQHDEEIAARQAGKPSEPATGDANVIE